MRSGGDDPAVHSRPRAGGGAAAARAGGGANIADQNARAREVKTLQSIFGLDRDGDDISTSDLHGRLRGLGGRRRAGESIIWGVDDDMDGQLSWQDFLNAYFRSQADAAASSRRFFFVAECLNPVDEDKSNIAWRAMAALQPLKGADAKKAMEG